MGYKDLEYWAAYSNIEFLRVPLGLQDFAGKKKTPLIILPVGSKFTKKARNFATREVRVIGFYSNPTP